MRHRLFWFFLVAASWQVSRAEAATRRVAVIVGNNAGNGQQPPLRYAEIDAAKVARVLTELGGVAKRDLFLLRGGGSRALRETLADATRRVASHRRDRNDRVVVIFYFSGHSDGVALELGRDRLAFTDLRRWLASTGADVRLALIDSCKSGALLAAKSGSPAPAFQIRLTDELASSGEALLTSSAADEIALESREIGGSFFTHHLVSGLRGAADSSGDGMVTLSEAYQYAYDHTIKATGATLVGPQHPVYDYRISGQGELILSELTKPTATIVLPAGVGRALIIERARGQVIAEVAADARAAIAVQPGGYSIRAWRGNQAFAGKVIVRSGQRRSVRWDELSVLPASQAHLKGSDSADVALARQAEDDPASRGPAFMVAAGAQRGVASGLGGLTSVRLGVRSRGPSGPGLHLDLASGRGPGFRETAVFLLAGYRLGLARGPFRAWGGLDLGAGGIYQTPDQGSSARSAAGVLAPVLGASLTMAGPFSLALEASLPVTALRVDGETELALLPGVWLGVLLER